MIVCQNCGTQNADSANVCVRCGSPLRRQNGYSGVDAGNPVIDAVRKCGKSPLFMIATAGVVLSVLLGIFGIVYNLLILMDMPGIDAPTIAGAISSGVVAVVFVGLIALGMILFMTSCLSKKSRISTAGLSIIKIIQIIEMVFLILGFVFFLVVFIVVIIVGNSIGMDGVLASISGMQVPGLDVREYFDTTGIAAVFNLVMIFLVLVMVAAFVFVLLYLIKTIKTINSVNRAIKTGTPNNNGSMYIVIMNFILALFMILGVFSNIIAYINPSSMGQYATVQLDQITFITTTANNVLSIIVFIAIAIGIIIYRNKMNSLMYFNPVMKQQSMSQSVVPSATQQQSFPEVTPVIVDTPTVEKQTFSCPKCGSELPEGSQFCTSCGEKL